MELYFEEEGTGTLDLEGITIAREVIDEVLDYEGCPYEAEIELLLTDNQTVQALNQEHRGIDKATDVLSFPLVDFAEPAEFDFLEQEPGCFNPESGRLMLGNIVVSKQKVIAQAEEYGHALTREYAFLIAHSMLHLLGYDHMEDEERRVMEERQEAILKRLHILR